MLTIVLVMLLILLVCGVVVAYVAFPHRREEMPVVPQLGDALRKGVDSLPTIGDGEVEAAQRDTDGDQAPGKRAARPTEEGTA